MKIPEVREAMELNAASVSSRMVSGALTQTFMHTPQHKLSLSLFSLRFGKEESHSMREGQVIMV